MNLTITAGPHTYKNCPMKALVNVSDLEVGEASLVDRSGKRMPCQIYIERNATYVAWIERELMPFEAKTYRLDTQPAGAKSEVKIENIGDDIIEVRIGGKLFTQYYYSTDYARPFLYPFINTEGLNVTRNYPMKEIPEEDHDHLHHRSVWIAYGEVNGVDCWTEGNNHGWIKHQRFEEVTGGPIFGRIRSKNIWTDKNGVKQMEDEREFTFFNVDNERLVDVKVALIAAYGDVALTDTKEGGIISVRVASTMDGTQKGLISNSYGGKTESETWGKPAQWVDYVGPVEGNTVGITIMDHPSSFRYPCRWHVRDYGLFAANPFALKEYEPAKNWNGDHTIKNGEKIDFGYRILVHNGNTEQANIKERFFGFAEPPKVTVSHSS